MDKSLTLAEINTPLCNPKPGDVLKCLGSSMTQPGKRQNMSNLMSLILKNLQKLVRWNYELAIVKESKTGKFYKLFRVVEFIKWKHPNTKGCGSDFRYLNQSVLLYPTWGFLYNIENPFNISRFFSNFSNSNWTQKRIILHCCIPYKLIF